MAKFIVYFIGIWLMFLLNTIQLWANPVSTTPQATTHHTMKLELQPPSFSEKYNLAEVSWLPDWQWESRGYNKRIGDGNDGSNPERGCSAYGMIDNIPEKSECTVSHPLQSLKCYTNCRCHSRYNKTSCPSNFTLGGDVCEGKYETCDPTPCPQGSSTTSSCDRLNYNKVISGYSGYDACYRCEPKPCPNSLSCGYGCQNYDSSRQAMCGNICVSCKACPINDCSSYALQNAPANANYTTCTIGCGNSIPHYKFSNCKNGFIHQENYWCKAPSNADCIALGYLKSVSDCTGKDILHCPFDHSKLFCY